MQFMTKLENGIRFIRFIIQHFIEDDCAYTASALAFTSLLAIVPLMSVGLAVFSTFPVFQDLATPVQNFIFEHFIPATGKVVQTYLQQFVSQVSKLSLWGIMFLLVTALLVMFTVEQAMNKIWRVTSSRKGVPAFLLYWSILSLAPIMLGLSIVVSSYVFSLPMLVNHNASSVSLHWLPFLLSLAGFVFLYMVVPNCKVRFRHAFWGGLFACISFEAAKKGFAYYLTQFPTYELLYGAFAAVPILFIWVYWVWFITLVGAEITYALSVNHQRRSGVALDGLTLSLIWLHELWIAQQEGKGLDFGHLVKLTNHPFTVPAEQVIHDMLQAGLIHSTTENQYMLSRDMNHVTLYELFKKLPYQIPRPDELQTSKLTWLTRWDEIITQYDKHTATQLALTLEGLFKS